MQSDIGILPASARALRRPAKINRVPGHETPIPIKNDRFELPILETCVAEPHDMGGFALARGLRHAREFGAQALINQKPHPAWARRGALRSVMILALRGKARLALGRPRAGLASA